MILAMNTTDELVLTVDTLRAGAYYRLRIEREYRQVTSVSVDEDGHGHRVTVVSKDRQGCTNYTSYDRRTPVHCVVQNIPNMPQGA